MLEPSLKILVCHYKEVYIQAADPAYLDIQCGKDETGLNLDMQGDNTGINISARNRYWSEITGLYWAWKNMEPVDYVGLCSYRRFFNFNHSTGSPVRIIPRSSALEVRNIDLSIVPKLMRKYDVIVPKPYTYAYSIRRVCSMNYVDRDFDLLEQIVHDLSPEYSVAYKKVFYDSNKMIGHNMFILSWDRFQEYCSWVFGILFQLEKMIDPMNYPIRKVRVFGYMHEILLGVFIEHHNLRCYYSQLTWISNNHEKFKFNSRIYRWAASACYHASRLWFGTDYRHIITLVECEKNS